MLASLRPGPLPAAFSGFPPSRARAPFGPLCGSVSKSLFFALILRVSSLPPWLSALSLSLSAVPPPHSLSLSLFVSMCSPCPTSAHPSLSKLRRKHPNTSASASQIYSPAAVAGWERQGEEGLGVGVPGSGEWQARGGGGVPSRTGAMHLAGGWAGCRMGESRRKAGWEQSGKGSSAHPRHSQSVEEGTGASGHSLPLTPASGHSPHLLQNEVGVGRALEVGVCLGTQV